MDLRDDKAQAVLFHARERRRSLAGIPELFRTHRVGGTGGTMAAAIAAAQFPTRTTLITFKTAVRITAAASVAGLLFEIGDSTAGVGAWLGSQTMGFHAGAAGTVNGATALFDNGAAWPDTLEMDLVFSVRPGDGRVRMWGNGRELASSVASGGAFTGGVWASASAGAFAQAVNGTTPADVLQTGAPVNFDVIEPLSVYVGSVPRHFV